MVDPGMLIAIGAGVLALAALIYGIVRKFTRVSWLSWQVLIVFAATLLVGVLPVPDGAWGGFAVAAGVLAGASALVLAVGGIVGHAMLARVRPAPLFVRFLSRLLGRRDGGAQPVRLSRRARRARVRGAAHVRAGLHAGARAAV